MVKFENLSSTLMAPLTLPLSPQGRGWVRGKFQIYLIDFKYTSILSLGGVKPHGEDREKP